MILWHAFKLLIKVSGNSKYTGERVGPSKYIVPDIGIEAEVLTKMR